MAGTTRLRLRPVSLCGVALLTAGLLGGCSGSPVDQATQARACEPDRRVYEGLRDEPALQQSLAGTSPEIDGIAPRFDNKTRQCGTTLVTARWPVEDQAEAARVVEELSASLLEDGWTETTGADVPPLLRGFDKVIGGEPTSLAVEHLPGEQVVEAIGRRSATR